MVWAPPRKTEFFPVVCIRESSFHTAKSSRSVVHILSPVRIWRPFTTSRALRSTKRCQTGDLCLTSVASSGTPCCSLCLPWSAQLHQTKRELRIYFLGVSCDEMHKIRLVATCFFWSTSQLQIPLDAQCNAAKLVAN